MTDAVIAALVGAAAAVAVAMFGPWTIRVTELSRQRHDTEGDVNLRYLAPLRQQLAEAVVRNQDVLDRISAGNLDALRALDDVDELRGKPTTWFAGAGCHLMSTAYLTAALFAELVRLRQAYPYLRLRDRDRDAELTVLTLRLHLSLSGVGGIYYAVQLGIGQDMITPDGRLASYPEFTIAVRDPERAPWYHQLIQLYRHAADDQTDGHSVDRLRRAVAAMHELSTFLDAAVGATASITTRLQAEATAAASARTP